MNLSDIRHRHRLGDFLNEMGFTGAMAEVGCAFGGFAKMTTKSWTNGAKYFMIDPWIRQSNEVYRERTEGVNYNAWFEECRLIASKDSRIQLIRKFSVDAAKDIPDGSLDVVYLDGNHSKEAITEDMRLWWPKVRRGGIFSGHDFYTSFTDGYWNEVDGPVKQFVFAHGLPIVITPCLSWWVEKP